MMDLPPEICLKILLLLDLRSFCRVSQTSQQWRGLFDDDFWQLFSKMKDCMDIELAYWFNDELTLHFLYAYLCGTNRLDLIRYFTRVLNTTPGESRYSTWWKNYELDMICKYDNLEVFKYFLSFDEFYQKIKSDQTVYLEIMLMRDSASIFKYYMNEVINPGNKSDWINTARMEYGVLLSTCIVQDFAIKIFIMLADLGIAIDNYEQFLQEALIRENSNVIISVINGSTYNISSEFIHELIESALSRNHTTVINLITNCPSIDVHYSNDILIKRACRTGCFKLVKLLLKKSYNKDLINYKLVPDIICNNSLGLLGIFLRSDLIELPCDNFNRFIELAIYMDNQIAVDMLENHGYFKFFKDCFEFQY